MSLCLINAGRSFGSQWAARNVDLAIGGGTALAILGPNGAGKSTLLRLMAGWIPYSPGQDQYRQSFDAPG